MGKTSLLAAVDLGSTTCKAAIFDLHGSTVAESRHEIMTRFSDSVSAEIDPEEWWRNVVVALREVTDAVGARRRFIAALGVTGLTHAPVLMDGEGNVITPAPLWMDRRSIPQCEELNAKYGHVIMREFGRPLINSLTAPKLKWFSENAAHVTEQASYLLMPKDYIRYRLTGTILTDYSDADGTGLLNKKNRQWSDELTRLVGMSPTQLPPLRESHEIAGLVTESAARVTGLPPGLPVVVGGSDVSCSLIGIGTLHPDLEETLAVYVGTAAWAAKVTGSKAAIEGSQSLSSCLEWIGATSSAGSSLTWLRDVASSAPIASDSCGEQVVSYDAILSEAGKAPIGSNGLFFHAHLMGERGPKENPRASGVWFGLTRHHRFQDLARSVLEGVAYSIRAILPSEKLQTVDGIIAFGGGSRDPLWRGIIRDVIGKTLIIPRCPEGGLMGAALIAGVGAGFFANYQQATERFIPLYTKEAVNRDAASSYEQLYRAYLGLETTFEGLYDQVFSVT